MGDRSHFEHLPPGVLQASNKPGLLTRNKDGQGDLAAVETIETPVAPNAATQPAGPDGHLPAVRPPAGILHGAEGLPDLKKARGQK